MPRLRFETVRALFEAYPSAEAELMIEPTDEPSLDFMRSLASQEPVDQAIGFCAYLLPRREAVWWGCQSVRTLASPASSDERMALQAAEDWVKDPEEERRFEALSIGRHGNYRVATTWLALAAGWAGGSMPAGYLAGFAGPTPAEAASEWVSVERDQTAKAVRTAILIASTKVKPQERSELLRKCVEDGARLAADEAR